VNLYLKKTNISKKNGPNTRGEALSQMDI